MDHVQFAGLFSTNAGGIALDHVFPIFDILPRSGDIRDQSRSGRKSTEILHVEGNKKETSRAKYDIPYYRTGGLIISRMISLGIDSRQTTTSRVYSKGNTPKF